MMRERQQKEEGGEEEEENVQKSLPALSVAPTATNCSLGTTDAATPMFDGCFWRKLHEEKAKTVLKKRT